MKSVFEKKNFDIIAKKVEGFWPYPPMFHEHMEIVYVLEGCIHMQIDGIWHNLTAGQMSMVFPYVVHSYERSDEAKAMILMFSPSEAGSFERKLLKYKPQNPYFEHGEAVLPFLYKINEYINSKDEEREKVAGAYLTTLMGELLLSVSLKQVTDTDLTVVQKLLVYCSENYKEDITIKSASAHLHVSESYVTKIFSQKLGCTFRDYINTLRVSEAQNLLKKSDMKIIEVMLTCGFQNQSSFNRVFLQESGVSPREYRDKYRKIKTEGL